MLFIHILKRFNSAQPLFKIQCYIIKFYDVTRKRMGGALGGGSPYSHYICFYLRADAILEFRQLCMLSE